MQLLSNLGQDRVLDVLRKHLGDGSRLALASPSLSLFAFRALERQLRSTSRTRLILPSSPDLHAGLLGGAHDRPFRNELENRRWARAMLEWLDSRADLRFVDGLLPQALAAVFDSDEALTAVLQGQCAFTTDGLGLTPGNRFAMVQLAETDAERAALMQWYSQAWSEATPNSESRDQLRRQLETIASIHPPSLLYHLVLFHLFGSRGDELDEERIVKASTGIKDKLVWKKLYKFQRDGVIGAIDKLERFGGCIIADSVGLGKTFEALAVIKYFELRNDRVLVLCPKRLRDNWTLYRQNDRRNPLAADRFNYDVLNHTDLSRDEGLSGDIDLAHVNWGNYDLVVIDESHNFRNKTPQKGKETRYERLMRRIIQEGVKTRVLMLSATPVNNRLADLKNQLAFITEDVDDALTGHGIPSIERTLRVAQSRFNQWQDLPEDERIPSRLMDMLGFDYFRLLDLLTIARSRKHVARYYGTDETGDFPERLPPLNTKADVDLSGSFPPIRDINEEIRRLKLGAYAPLRYVLPSKREAYERRYATSVRGGKAEFRQTDREESLVQLMRVNLLKRMESSVHSFAATVERILAANKTLVSRIDAHDDELDAPDIRELADDDPLAETLLVGNKVKVLLSDVDRIKWRQDLTEDVKRLSSLLESARRVPPKRDAKLAQLRDLIREKTTAPLNPGNRKILVFTAFADTAEYLYDQLADWALESLGIHSAIITGTGRNGSNLPGLPKNMASVLSAFAPRAKERAEEFADEGEIDLLIATDCISEGQNLQDCDFLINYDIHWNPVRIIQRFGRIDRLGSPNDRIQLVNFWPNMELEEYINLEQRVSGRMVLLDVSATGEENVIEFQSGNQMNDLEYRRKQLLRLRDTVIDLEDLSSGVAITDLTLNDLRVDLARFIRSNPDLLEALPLGLESAVSDTGSNDSGTDGSHTLAPGTLFLLRAEGDAATALPAQGYPLAPHYLVHVADDGTISLPFTQTKQLLDRLRQLCHGRHAVHPDEEAMLDSVNRKGASPTSARAHLSKAVASIIGRTEEHEVASLFRPGGTVASKGSLPGEDDFEVVARLTVLPAREST